jgi:hypothetical protein
MTWPETDPEGRLRRVSNGRRKRQSGLDSGKVSGLSVTGS